MAVDSAPLRASLQAKICGLICPSHWRLVGKKGLTCVFRDKCECIRTCGVRTGLQGFEVRRALSRMAVCIAAIHGPLPAKELKKAMPSLVSCIAQVSIV